jgi:small-conductance mechanosensitive channel
MFFLVKVKEDNAEIATMEQQIAEIQDHMNRLQEEHSQIEQVCHQHLPTTNRESGMVEVFAYM